MKITNVTNQYKKCPDCKTRLTKLDILKYEGDIKGIINIKVKNLDITYRCPKCFEVWRFEE